MTHGSKSLLLGITFCYLVYLLLSSLPVHSMMILKLSAFMATFVLKEGKQKWGEIALISPLTPENNSSSLF
jgi:hypothetical protein